MTLKEVARQLGKSENTIYKNFNVTQENLAKKGILLMKWGRGKTLEYELEYEEVEEDEEEN
jgi:AraC-like DNA-binding protein